jgi:hypothetical protein
MTTMSRRRGNGGLLPRLAAVTTALIFTLQCSGAAWADQWFDCQPDAVAFIPKKRIHVRCSNPQNNISFFAMKAKGKDTPVMLTLLTEAMAQGWTVAVFFDLDDLSGEKFGCQNADCRIMKLVSVGP